MKKIRKKIVAGNWKMNGTTPDAKNLAEGIVREVGDMIEVDVLLCPPFTALKTVGDIVMDTHVKLGAQNMYYEASGAYTGEISSGMLRDLYCHYVILGHSERRSYFNETSEIVNRKVKAALAAALIPIVCVGETLEERESGNASVVTGDQVRESLAGIDPEAMRKVIVAYEPVWAIGTGRTATPEQAQEMHAFIRKCVGEIFGVETAAAVRIQYGGSVKSSNAADLFAQKDIDGALVGGAALDVKSFSEIVRAGV